MNQDQVKEALLSLDVSTVDFTLLFSGKASKKVNGLYKPATHEIIIHNKNFKNDNALMFTAIHELVHHIAMTRCLVKTRTAHPIAFWAIFHSLLEIAVKKGVYSDPFAVDEGLKAQGHAILAILAEQLAVQKRLGAALRTMQGLCEEKGARFEDYLDRRARIPRTDATAAMTAQLELFEDMPPLSPQIVNVTATLKGDERAEAFRMVAEGCSLQQIKAVVRQKLVIDPRVDHGEEKTTEDMVRALEKKLQRMKSTKESLGHEIEALELEIDQLLKQGRLGFHIEAAIA